MSFGKNHIPWNKGKKTGFIPKSAFKNGEKPIHPFLKGNIPWNKGKSHDQIKGEKNPKWKGGRSLNGYGYWLILNQNHPNAINGYIKEHRFVMEQKLGRILNRKEIVHHVNGIKIDNRPENLELFNNSEHSRLHMKRRYG